MNNVLCLIPAISPNTARLCRQQWLAVSLYWISGQVTSPVGEWGGGGGVGLEWGGGGMEWGGGGMGLGGVVGLVDTREMRRRCSSAKTKK